MEKQFLGGKTSLNDSVVVAAEVASLKKLCELSRAILPIDSEAKAAQYREILQNHWNENLAAKKLKKV